MAVSTPSLPQGITDLMRSLARRAHMARAIRGACLVLVVLGLGFGLIFLADAWFGLFSPGLRLASLVWALSVLLVLGWKVAFPILRRSDPYALAVLVEQRYPDLEERLSATVALARHCAPAHGAASLIEQLSEEADERCRPLRSSDVLPFHPLRGWLVGAGLVLGLTIVAFATMDEYRFFSRRFVSAWFDPVLGYRVEVTPGDGAVAVGDALTIGAHLVIEETGVTLPDACHVIYRVGDQPEQKRRLGPVTEQTFRLALEHVNADLVYQVEAGEYRSPKYRVAAVMPVMIEEEILEVTPPPYVNPKALPRSSQAIRPMISRTEEENQLSVNSSQAILQYSKVRYMWRFNRAVPQAKACWQSSVQNTLQLQWTPDRRQAEVEFVAGAVGVFSLMLTLDAEHGIRSRRLADPLKVFADDPPAFTEKLDGLPPALSAKDALAPAAPDEILRLRTRVEDKVGLDQLELEYRVNDDAVQGQMLAKADGQQVIAGVFPFHLQGKVKDGDVIKMRLKATDNRFLKMGSPLTDLAPQVTYEPALKGGKDSWFAIRIDARAKPLFEQEIAGDRQKFNHRLAQIKKKLEREQALVKQIKQAGHAQAFLAAQALENLDRALQLNRDIAKELFQFAAETLSLSGLLAELALDMAQDEISAAEQSLTAAERKHRDPAMRDQNLDQADHALSQALKKLASLADANDRLAQNRLDEMELQRLADLQDELARRAAGLAKDPAAKEDLDRLRAEQDRVAEQLENLSRRSQLFQDAMLQHQLALAQRLAQQARDLGKRQRITKPGDPKQKELAEETGKLAEELMRLGQRTGNPKSMTGAKEAAHSAQEAKAAMDKAAKETDSARAMDAAKEAALKLEMAAKKTEEMAQAMPKLMSKESDETGKALEKAQEDVNKARDSLRKSEPAKAQPSMKQAAQAMQQAAQQAGRQLAKSQRQVGPQGRITSPRPTFGAEGSAGAMPLQEVLGKFNGQSWGALSGEVKNRIMQDWQTRYGSDFAQVVRRYFEQLAVGSRQ